MPTRVVQTTDMSDTPFTDQVRQQNPGVEIRGDETFEELLEIVNRRS